MTQALALLIVFGAVLGPLHILAEAPDSAAQRADPRRWAARSVGLAAALILPLALLGGFLTALGFNATALTLALGIVLLAGALHSLWGGRAPNPSVSLQARSLILTPSGVAVALLLPSAHTPRWLVLGALLAVMAADLLALTLINGIRRRAGPEALRVAAWVMSIFVVCFSVQLMARSVTDLVCDAASCGDDDTDDAGLRQARAHGRHLAAYHPGPAPHAHRSWPHLAGDLR